MANSYQPVRGSLCSKLLCYTLFRLKNLYVKWSVLTVDRRSRTKEQKITSDRSPFT